MNMNRPGLWIAFEGADGVGKTTQAQLLADRLGTTVVAEPGGSELGQRIRSIVKTTEIDGEHRGMVETLLMTASRVDNYHRTILPALERGEVVVTDRCVLSTAMYQGVGRGVGDTVMDIHRLACPEADPDVVILLYADEGTRRERVLASRDGEVDIFEDDDNLVQTVADAYTMSWTGAIAETTSVAVVLESDRDAPEVARSVYRTVRNYLKDKDL